jgi:hypothetical protein
MAKQRWARVKIKTINEDSYGLECGHNRPKKKKKTAVEVDTEVYCHQCPKIKRRRL